MPSRTAARVPWWTTVVVAGILAVTLVVPATRDLALHVLGLPLTIGVAVATLIGATDAVPRAAAGWGVLAVVGFASSLQLIDAPATVAYQHYDFLAPALATRIALAICVLQLLVIATMGRDHLRAILGWIKDRRRPSAVVLVLLAAVATSAVPSKEPGKYLAEVIGASLLQLLSVVTLVAAARSAPPGAWDAFSRWTDRLLGIRETPRSGPMFILAGLVTLTAALLAWFAYEAHPHVPDEVIYLLHARALADGMLTMPLPPVPAGFNIDLMHYEATRWYSPVPPGWPMILAAGAAVGVPWLVNPVLGGVAVLLAWQLLEELVPQPTARLATLLLAASPWFLFLSMSLMTHNASLVCALGAALGVARMRRTGRWQPALAGGGLAGAVSLIRPLEGLVTAGLLGLWSFGGQRRAHRLLAPAVFAVGVVLVGGLVRPYNAMLTGSPSVFPIMAYVDKYYAPGSNDMGFGPNRGLGWSGLDPFPGHGPVDVGVNTALNAAQTNVELLGWPVGAITILALGLLAARGDARRRDAWFAVAVAGVIGAHAFYWFSGGPDFGARYWYLMILPACVLVARSLEWIAGSMSGAAPSRVRAAALGLVLLAATLYVPWRAVDKYYHYRGMRADIRELARQHAFGRSLVLVRGRRHPDYSSAATYNPLDLRSAAPIYAWDATVEIRTRLLEAYADRPVWIVDGPSITGNGFRVVAGPLTTAEAAVSPIRPDAAGDWRTYDPVDPPPEVRIRGLARSSGH